MKKRQLKKTKKDYFKLNKWLCKKNISFPIPVQFDITNKEHIKSIGSILKDYEFIYKSKIYTIKVMESSNDCIRDMKKDIKSVIKNQANSNKE